MIQISNMLFVQTSVIAGESIPVEALFTLLKIDDEQKAEAKAQGRMPIARLDQFENAM